MSTLIVLKTANEIDVFDANALMLIENVDDYYDVSIDFGLCVGLMKR